MLSSLEVVVHTELADVVGGVGTLLATAVAGALDVGVGGGSGNVGQRVEERASTLHSTARLAHCVDRFWGLVFLIVLGGVF